MNASFGWSEKGSEIDVDVHDYDGARPPGVCLSLKKGMEWLSIHLKNFDQAERIGQEIAMRARLAKQMASQAKTEPNETHVATVFP